MITRFVKMHFKPELKKDFIILFYESVEVIKKFEGCLDVVLLEDADDESSLCTLSFWKDLSHLENYRKSEFFKSTWHKTKSLFSQKAQAWSLIEVK